MAFTPLNTLNAYLEVARRRSFAGAARELGVSPSALSQSVRQLEARLGVTARHAQCRIASSELARGPAAQLVAHGRDHALALPTRRKTTKLSSVRLHGLARGRMEIDSFTASLGSTGTQITVPFPALNVRGGRVNNVRKDI